MSKIKFKAYWEPNYQIGIEKDYLKLKPDLFYKKIIAKMLDKLGKWQEWKRQQLTAQFGEAHEDDYLRKLDITIEINYRGRSLDQNALMWALYEILANEQNAGMAGDMQQMVKPMDLYIADLLERGERETIITARKNLDSVRREYRVIEWIIWGETKFSLEDFIKMVLPDTENISIGVIRGSSKFNTREMAQWIDGIFNRLAWQSIEVTNSGEIETYWREHRQHMNDKKIVLYDELMTQQEYKDKTPICEGCNKSLIDGSGQLAHIKGFGMGGARVQEPTKNYSSNWLHLCPECHLAAWHGKGWKTFLQGRSWLKYKVTRALKKDYQIKGDLC